jgi:epoxide hydrolase
VSEAVEPFAIHVPETDIQELARRLAVTRLPDQVGDHWRYGTPVAHFRSLVEYWRNGFDWRAQEAQLNGFAQFRP